MVKQKWDIIHFISYCLCGSWNAVFKKHRTEMNNRKCFAKLSKTLILKKPYKI